MRICDFNLYYILIYYFGMLSLNILIRTFKRGKSVHFHKILTLNVFYKINKLKLSFCNENLKYYYPLPINSHINN